MSNYTRIAAVTGANKGIGFAIVRQLALQYPKSALNNGPLLIYLTARDAGRGQQAVKDILADSQLKAAKALRSDGGLADVKYAQLDISDKKSIDAFTDFLKNEHGAGIDIAINNAGIALDGFDNSVVEKTLASNYYGTLEATERFLAILKPDGRLVNVSSMSGKLGKYSESIRSRFLNSKSVDDVTALMEEFKAGVKAGTHKEDGWPSAAYAVSKAGVTGMTKVIAAREKAKGSSVLINCCCPGYVNTDMSKGNGSLSPDQGAQTPVHLALGDIGDQTGLFWEHKKPSQW